MSMLNFSAKRLCLLTLMWSGLPVQAKTELLVLGTPAVPSSILTSTITITTTVSYQPSLIPGNSQYTLVGCYSPLSRDRGHIFGPDDYNACSDDKVTPPSNLTIDSCLRGCSLATPPRDGIETYIYTGLRNGSECRCGNQLSTDAHKLPAGDCTTPCSGDPRLSCGGHENIAVYSLMNGTHQQGSSTSDSSTLANSETEQSTTPNPSTSSTIGTKAQPAASPETLRPSAGPRGRAKPVPTPTIAAVTGSLSGAVFVAAGLFLCYRARTRKKRIHDSHVRAMLERRGRRSIQSPMFTEAEIRSHVASFAATRHEQRNNDDNDWENTPKPDEEDPRLAERDLAPSTLAGGGEFPGGLRPRTKSVSAAAAGSAAAAEEEEKEEEAERSGVAASSAVQWWPRSANSGSAATPERTNPSNGIAPPAPSARIDGLGDRAWHRRKLSTPYQPPAAGGVGRGEILARSGPPSAPPTGALPPTPPGPRAVADAGPRGDMAGAGWNRGPPPPRPRRSFEAIELGDHEEPEASRAGAGAGLGIGPATSEGNPVGMSRPNMSTPSLGRYGSLSKSRRANVESPVLGWQTLHGRGQWGTASRETREAASVDRQPQLPKLPALPPIAPGERFDHKRWRGTRYAEPYERERGGQPSGGGEMTPVSASSTGTSILFGLEEFDRRL
ncbi:hypothetical protein F4824DRAFT_361344 [Ustulina deusta]|nr:hypothetical protein F4824DRAFT_361344 [Ustulina deusta]